VPVSTVDAFDEAAVKAAITDALAAGELRVLVALAPCVLIGTGSRGAVVVDDDRCNLCGLCLELGCPAVAAGDESVEITSDCTGCGVCLAVCARGAISAPEPPDAAEPSKPPPPGRERRLHSGAGRCGGSGILLAATIVAQAAMAAGFEVKTSEVHGMAQRGAACVDGALRQAVWSPVAPRADLVIATETLEGRRALGLLADKGTLVYATTVIAPGSVLRGERAYPTTWPRRPGAPHQLIAVDAEALGREAGSVRAPTSPGGRGRRTRCPLPRVPGSAPRAAVPPRCSNSTGGRSPLGREPPQQRSPATEEGREGHSGDGLS